MRSYPMARVDLFAVNDEFAKHRVRTSHFEYRYTAFLASRYDDLESSFNCPPLERRRFLRSTPDAWSKKARRIFYAHGCFVHGHEVPVEHPNTAAAEGGSDSRPTTRLCGLLPVGMTSNIYGETFQSRAARFETMTTNILNRYPGEVTGVEVEYQCDFERKMVTPGTPEYAFFHPDGEEKEEEEKEEEEEGWEDGWEEEEEEEDYQEVGGLGISGMNYALKRRRPRPKGTPPRSKRKRKIKGKKWLAPPYLVVREALKGGYCELLHLTAQASDGFDLRYYDINSL